ncbi:GNAT family N-acetyltransferase [uncultured Hymenobacter sp.]|uniref:GNAT family N-acetyltransferase n=1 Tax=uncultured Hymenobacter sp. TaxID=170016 RepID=UPI0035C9F9D5
MSLAIPATTALFTPRLHLRPYVPADAPAFFGLLNQHRSRLRQAFPDRTNTVYDLAAAARALAGFARDWQTGRFYVFGIWQQETGPYLGDICLMPKLDGSAEIGYYLAPEAEGHGYAREALAALVGFGFDAVGAQRLVIRCYENNPRAHAVARAAGFRVWKTTPTPRRHWWSGTAPIEPTILHFALERGGRA